MSFYRECIRHTIDIRSIKCILPNYSVQRIGYLRQHKIRTALHLLHVVHNLPHIVRLIVDIAEVADSGYGYYQQQQPKDIILHKE